MRRRSRDTAKARTIVLAFARVDADTVTVTLTGRRDERVYHETRSGAVTEPGDS